MTMPKGFFRNKVTWWVFGAAVIGAGGTLTLLLLQKVAHLEAISADIKQASKGGTPGTAYAQQVLNMTAMIEDRATTYGEEVARKAATDTLTNVYGIPKALFESV